MPSRNSVIKTCVEYKNIQSIKKEGILYVKEFDDITTCAEYFNFLPCQSPFGVQSNQVLQSAYSLPDRLFLNKKSMIMKSVNHNDNSDMPFSHALALKDYCSEYLSGFGIGGFGGRNGHGHLHPPSRPDTPCEVPIPTMGLLFIVLVFFTVRRREQHG